MSRQNTRHFCVWHVGKLGDHSKSAYCGKPVKYHMTQDDDGTMVRAYEPFCEEHTKKAKEQED